METRQDEVERGGEGKRVRHFGGDESLRKGGTELCESVKIKTHTVYKL